MSYFSKLPDKQEPGSFMYIGELKIDSVTS